MPPVLSDRVAGATSAAAAAAAELPASMAALGGPRYRYVLFHFWFITVTKRSLSLALAFAGLTFTALQAASLCLVTTPPESMAGAVGRALRPLGLLGLPVKELVLTMLLALRFMATVGCCWQKSNEGLCCDGGLGDMGAGKGASGEVPAGASAGRSCPLAAPGFSLTAPSALAPPHFLAPT